MYRLSYVTNDILHHINLKVYPDKSRLIQEKTKIVQKMIKQVVILSKGENNIDILLDA